MIYCCTCGTELPDTAKFCIECGAPQKQDETSPQQTNQKDAARGDAEDWYNLGIKHYAGKGVPQDYDKARQWYEKAAAQGHADAQYNLGDLYDNG